MWRFVFNHTRRYPLSYVNQVGVYYWASGYLYNQDSLGHWWTATAYDSSNAYYMILATTYLQGDGHNNKLYGFSLRSNTARRYPLSYVYSGRYSWGDGNLYLQDSYGVWWSTAASSDSNAYLLYMDSNSLLPQHNVNKALGFALHCVSRSILCPSVSAFVCVLRLLLLGQW